MSRLHFKVLTDILRKGHSHKSKKDYDRKKLKQQDKKNGAEL